MPRTWFAVALVALAVAGCGGSNSKSSSGARGYAGTGKALDALCAKYNAQFAALSHQANGNAKHDAPLIDKLAAIEDKAIKPDPKLQAAFDQYIAIVNQQIA